MGVCAVCGDRGKKGGVLGERLKCQLLEFSFKHHGQFGAITSWHPCLGVTVLRTACLVKTFIGDWLPKNKAEKRVMMKNNPYGHLNHFFLMWALKEKSSIFFKTTKPFQELKNETEQLRNHIQPSSCTSKRLGCLGWLQLFAILSVSNLGSMIAGD